MRTINGKGVDVRLLVEWLGSEGTKAGLTTSRRCSVKVLRLIAEGMGCAIRKDMNRQQIIDEIVDVASRRVDKPLDSLFKMSQQELVDYFTGIEVEPKELLELLKRLDIEPHREGLRSLIEFTAQQISETGRYMRIASSPDQGSKPPL